jgi:hypothetical protein
LRIVVCLALLNGSTLDEKEEKMATKVLNAVWHSGSGAQFWKTGLDLDELKAKDAEHFNNGLRIVRLQVDDGGDDCTVLWRAGSGAQFWKSRRTVAQFKGIDDDFFKKGLRIQSIHVDGDSKITACWRPGTGAQFWQAGMTFTKLKDKTTEMAGKGLLLFRVARYGSDYNRHFAVWRPGSGGFVWHVGLTIDQYDLLVQQLFDLGFHLFYPGLWGNNGIWRPGSGFQKHFRTTSVLKFKLEDATQFKKGRRMTDFHVGWTY